MIGGGTARQNDPLAAARMPVVRPAERIVSVEASLQLAPKQLMSFESRAGLLAGAITPNC